MIEPREEIPVNPPFPPWGPFFLGSGRAVGETCCSRRERTGPGGHDPELVSGTVAAHRCEERGLIPLPFFPQGFQFGDRLQVFGAAGGALHVDERVEVQAKAPPLK
jgi:hypothetical protein